MFLFCLPSSPFVFSFCHLLKKNPKNSRHLIFFSQSAAFISTFCHSFIRTLYSRSRYTHRRRSFLKSLFIKVKMAATTAAFSSSSSLLSKSNVVKSSKRSPLRGKTCIAMAGKPFEVPKKYTKVQPMGGRVLIKIAETERETKGGVLLTEGSQQKPTSGALSSSS